VNLGGFDENSGPDGMDRRARNVVIASFLGWTLDAFDFFLMVFVLKDIAQEFNTSIATGV
jgi:SHS family lactate transporter-like MFS transporter